MEETVISYIRNPDYQDMKKAYRTFLIHHIKRNAASFLVLLICFSVAFVGGIYPYKDATAAFVIINGVSLLSLILGGRCELKHSEKAYQEMEPLKIRINEEALSIHNTQFDTRYIWDYFDSAMIMKDYICLYKNRTRKLVFYKHLLHESDAELLMSHIKRHVDTIEVIGG